MRLTVAKTFLLSFLLLIVLGIVVVAVSFLRVNRTVLVDGVFAYRHERPVTVSEAGTVVEIKVHSDEMVEAGDPILILRNRDLEMEAFMAANRLEVYELELEEILEAGALETKLGGLDVGALEDRLRLARQEPA